MSRQVEHLVGWGVVVAPDDVKGEQVEAGFFDVEDERGAETRQGLTVLSAGDIEDHSVEAGAVARSRRSVACPIAFEPIVNTLSSSSSTPEPTFWEGLRVTFTGSMKPFGFTKRNTLPPTLS
jgi:hypothetical protein